MDEKSPPPSDLEPIPGDTYALRAELKALGAVWDPAARVWRIAPEKLALATALVENQALVPEPAPQTDDSGELIDPFEQESDAPRMVALGKGDGATYDARDALRAVGARWDKDRRSWMIREERADYARAVLTGTAGLPATGSRPTESEPRPPKAPPAAPVAPNTPTVLRETEREPYQASPASPNVREETSTPQEATRPMATDRIKLGGLWLNKSKDGREYLTGKLSPTVKILIFKNDFKTSDNQPSHVMYLAPVEQDETQRPASTPAPASFFGAEDEKTMSAAANTGMEMGMEVAFAGGGVADDDFFPEEDAAPPSRPTRPGGVSPAKANSRPAPPPQTQAPRRPASGSSSPPAPSRPQNRPPQPAPAQEESIPSEGDDFSDPFDD